MKLHEKLERVIAARDFDAYINFFHEDFTATLQKSGNSLRKEDTASVVTGMLAIEQFVHDFAHCVYENDDIFIQHNFMSYTDDKKETVMLVVMRKDDNVIN